MKNKANRKSRIRFLYILLAVLTVLVGTVISGCRRDNKPVNVSETEYVGNNDEISDTGESSKIYISSESEEIKQFDTSYESETSMEADSEDDSVILEEPDKNTEADTNTGQYAAAIDEDGEYTSKDDVALYIHTYGKLPDNFITKKEAKSLGWEGGSVEPYAPGKSIGGDHFGNYEGNLPEKDGRTYYECDIDTKGEKSRGAKRIVFSNDGLIYYTEDHYETFTLLYD